MNTTRAFALSSAFVQALNESDAAEVVEYTSACGSPGRIEDLASAVFRKNLARAIAAEWEAGIGILSPYAFY